MARVKAISAYESVRTGLVTQPLLYGIAISTQISVAYLAVTCDWSEAELNTPRHNVVDQTIL